MNLKVFRDFIGQNKPIVLTTHQNPDGDGLSAQVGLHHILSKLGHEVHIRNNDPIPEKYDFMDPKKIIKVVEPEKLDIEEFNLIVLDTSDPNHMGDLGQVLLKRASTVFIIDHHNGPNTESENNWIDSSKSSTAEMIYDLAKIMEVSLPLHVSKALFAGIVYDTGSFIYPKTGSHTFEVASLLVKSGVKPKEIHSLLYENKPASSFKLLAQIQASFYTAHKDRVAVQTMTAQMLKNADATYEESENIINYPLKSPQIVVSVFFKEDLEGEWRCSIRSKGKIDVAKFSQQFGGGGHKNAAGFPMKPGKVENQIETVIKELGNLLSGV